MKFIKQILQEKFTEETDPVKDLKIGVAYKKMNFDSLDEATDFLFGIIPAIFKTQNIPEDIVYKNEDYEGAFKWKYYWGLDDYCQKYIMVRGTSLHFQTIYKKLWDKLLQLGYPKVKQPKNIDRGHEFLIERFVEDSDPVHDMGIGIDRPRTFKNKDEITKWVFKILPHILETEKIPEDIIANDGYFIKKEYTFKIQRYAEKYFNSDDKIWRSDTHPNWEKLNKMLKRRGYGKMKKVNEKFEENSDPIHDMGIGIRSQIEKDLKQINMKLSDVEIEDDGTIYLKGYVPYYGKENFKQIQFKYLPELKKKFVKNLEKKLSNDELEKCVKEALTDKISKEDIDKLTKEFFPEKSRLVQILYTKLTRTKKEIKHDEENNLYVFIGYTDKVPVIVSGKKYYEDKLGTEGIIKIDKFNVSDLSQITMMKLRCRYQNYEDGQVYMIYIPKELMDEDRYNQIPDHMYDIFEKYKRKV